MDLGISFKHRLFVRVDAHAVEVLDFPAGASGVVPAMSFSAALHKPLGLYRWHLPAGVLRQFENILHCRACRISSK
jgi:hypothetical protein